MAGMMCALPVALVALFVQAAVVDGMGGIDDSKRLHNELFKERDYNPILRPAHDYSKPTIVTIQMAVSQLLSLDVKKQILHVQGFLPMRWQDDLLKWEPKDYGNISRFSVPQTMVWRPDIVFYNSADEKMFPGSDETHVTVLCDGSVRWEPVFVLMSTCKVDISKYPFDVNICPILLHSWMSNNSTVFMEFAEKPLNWSFYIQNGEYILHEEGVFSKEMVFIYDTPEFYQQMGVKLKLERRSAYICLTLLLPVAMLAILSVISFMLPHDHPDKLSMAISVLLSFTVFMTVIDNNLPETSDNISLLVVYVTLMLFLAFIGVIGNAIVLLIHRRECAEDKEVSNSPSHDQLCENNTFAASALDEDSRRMTLNDKTSDSKRMLEKRSPSGKDEGDLWFMGIRSKAAIVNKTCFVLNTLCVLVLSVFFLVKLLS